MTSVAARSLLHTYGHVRLAAAIRDHLDMLRAGGLATEGPDSASIASVTSAVATMLAAGSRPSLKRVANLTGTVLHTNLGRAMLPEAAIAAMIQAARSPCNLEFDLGDGHRGERDRHVEDLLVQLTGAEAALVVNNNAAAVFLLLNTLALRREAIVSRGELIEIGGHFRIPDVMTRAGARLREVGTTNRTHLQDYADAITARTALILKVHTSNYEVRGFTSSVPEAALARLATENTIPLVADLGSGTLVDFRHWNLPYEPTARDIIAAGVDLVTFSGDKLLGGPQCGVVAGKAALVEKLRRNPLKRALRVDKITLSALEQVLRLYLDPEQLAANLPTLRLLTRSKAEIELVAQHLRSGVAGVLPPSYVVDVVACSSQIGSGALPVDTIPSSAVRITSNLARRQRDAAVLRLAKALRQLPVPMIGRVADHALLLDCRCVEDVAELVAQLGDIELSPSGASP